MAVMRPFRRRQDRWLGRLARAAILLAIVAAPGAARAHSGGSANQALTGLPIQPISHGEMALVDERLGDIITLAKVQVATDGPIRRRFNHYNVQFAYCLWGLVPGGVTREDSSFNPCSHAYLAAAKELLLAMSREPASKDRALAILDRLEQRRRVTPEAGEICSSSGDTFNTTAMIRPSLADVVGDPVSAMAGLGLASVLVAGGFAVRLMRGRSTADGGRRVS